MHLFYYSKATGANMIVGPVLNIFNTIPTSPGNVGREEGGGPS